MIKLNVNVVYVSRLKLLEFKYIFKFLYKCFYVFNYVEILL